MRPICLQGMGGGGTEEDEEGGCAERNPSLRPITQNEAEESKSEEDVPHTFSSSRRGERGRGDGIPSPRFLMATLPSLSLRSKRGKGEVEEEEEDRARIANLEIALPYPFRTRCAKKVRKEAAAREGEIGRHSYLRPQEFPTMYYSS